MSRISNPPSRNNPVFTGNIFNRGRVFVRQTVPGTATDTTALSDAQMLGGILVGTPTAAATYTLRTGAEIEAALAALGAVIEENDAFELTVINLGGAGDIITMDADTGVAIIGSATIDDAGPDINSSGTFRFQRLASAETFFAFRIC